VFDRRFPLRELLAAAGSVVDLLPDAEPLVALSAMDAIGSDWRAVGDDLLAALAAHPIPAVARD